MKKFLRTVIITFALFLIVLAASVCINKEVVKHCRDDNPQYRHLKDHPSSVRVLLAGHSHTASGFDASRIDSCYCIAKAGRASYYDTEIIRHFADSLPNLYAVILPMSYEYEAARFYLEHDFMVHEMSHYKRFWGIEPPAHLMDRGTKWAYWKDLFHWTPHHEVLNEYGQSLLGNVVGNAISVYDAPCGRKVMGWSLAEIAQICQERGVRFIAITCPGNSTYLSNCVTPTGIDSLYSLIDSVRRFHPIEYHCYLGDTMFDDDNLFFDQTHLNGPGATLFAERVKKDFGL